MSDALDALAEQYKAEPATRAIYLQQQFVSIVMGALRGARIASGMTQADLAVKLETTQSVVARMERDHTGMTSLRRIAAYAIAVGVDLNLGIRLD